MAAWLELTRLTDAELAAHDIAAVNLACAAGLPGADRIDVAACLRTLDGWAAVVHDCTEPAFDPLFRRDPARYDHSPAVFRVVRLVTTLQKVCGARYDPAKIGVPLDAPMDLHEEFVHGVTHGPGGTCATLPVVLAAVGRRLGYPIKLVSAKAHLFARWDDPAGGERVNVEWSNAGLNCHPDDYYRRRPFPITPDEEQAFGYLESMTPREELAEFIGRRGHTWQQAGTYRRAVGEFGIAAGLDERHRRFPDCIRSCVLLWQDRLLGWSLSRLNLPTDRPPPDRRWPTVPWETERAVRVLEATEDESYGQTWQRVTVTSQRS